MDDQLNGTIILLCCLSPYLIALIKKDAWPKAFTEFISVVIVILLVVLGRWFDGKLTWPLSSDFWVYIGLGWAAQQGLFKFVLRQSKPLQQLEDFWSKKEEQA